MSLEAFSIYCMLAFQTFETKLQPATDEYPKMIEPHLRRSMRIPVAYKGVISDGQRTLKCLIQDVSDSGMLIVASEPFKIGQILDLTCDIEPGRYLECKIEVRFCDDTCMGVRIVEISAQSAGGFQHCVDDDFSTLPEKS